MASAVKPIPDGMHSVTPHLICKGCNEAIEFYKKAFGAAGEMCMPMPDGKTVAHAELKIGDSYIFLADEFPPQNLSPQSIGGSPVTIHLYVEDCDKVFEQAVKAGATATMPPMDMFWGDRYAKVADPFGHQWSIATHKEDVSPEEMAKRGAEAMKEFCKE